MIYAGAMLGSLIDLGVLLLLPTMIVVLLSFTTSAASFLVVAAAAILFLFHTVGLSQAINLATAGILRSRRGRDILAVAIPLLMSVFYLVSQLLPGRMAQGHHCSRFLESRTWNVISYLPPGLAARAIGGAGRGEFAPALGFLLLLAGLSALTLYLAGWLVQLVYTGEAGSPAARKRAERPAPGGSPGRALPAEAGAPAPRSWLSRLPPAVAAVADKELKYLFRDPFFKATLSQTVYMLVVVGVMMVQTSRMGEQGIPGPGRGWFLWGATGMLLMTQSQLALNAFGADGAAAAVLFLFPSPRRHILIGKNLVLFAALSVVDLVFVVALCALARQLRLLPEVLAWTALASVVFVACGNLVSVYFPVRVVIRGWVVRRSSSIGFAQLATYFVVVLIVGMLALPVLASVIVPTYWVHPFWLALTIPVSIAYVCSLYMFSLHLAERALLEREASIVGKLRQEE
jgi:ABC-2 type transport system permease protein